jgi:uncharacterized protein YjbI with pentapeptide repeats
VTAVANEEHIELLKQGVEAWNAWREKAAGYPDADANLQGASLEHADLRGANLRRATLHSANLEHADLRRANLQGSNLIHANLDGASLDGADLRHADLSRADLCDAKLACADLRHADLTRADLSYADLCDAKLEGANLRQADLSRADLNRASLEGAHLENANLSHANLEGANLKVAFLNGTNLNKAKLNGANLANAGLTETAFTNVDLTSVTGLEACTHLGPSIIDHRTLEKSSPLPLSFLRGVGLPNRLIEYLPSIFNQAFQYYSCFISYSAKDQDFAHRIHTDLQDKGVRCWFAPHDLLWGGKIRDEIDVAIRLRDKLLLILSEHSLRSHWVEDEVEKAFDEERNRKQTVLFPIRIDDAVVDTDKSWARTLRVQRNIGHFPNWKDHNSYKVSFERLMRDLASK